RRRMDCGPAAQPRAHAPPHAPPGRRYVGRARARVLRAPRLDRADSALSRVLSRARGHACGAAGASRRRAAGARLEPPSMKRLLAMSLSAPGIVAALDGLSVSRPH